MAQRQKPYLHCAGGCHSEDAWCVLGCLAAPAQHAGRPNPCAASPRGSYLPAFRSRHPAMFDVRVVLRSGSFDHIGGFPRGQWLDLLYNVDARAMILTALPEELRRTFHESTMTTADIESHFSRIPNTSSDSNKPTKELSLIHI